MKTTLARGIRLLRLPVWHVFSTVLGVTAICLVAAPLEFPDADPRDQGISPAALRYLHHTLEAYANRSLVVGSAFVVIKNHRTVLAETYGWEDRELGRPMTEGTLFNIRSMTKMITGAAAQILIDEGQLDLHDKVFDYLPGFDRYQSRDITIRHLLTHRSGLPLSILTSLDDYPDLQAMANEIGRRGPQFQPGSKFWYSDAGTDTLGAIVEVVSGQLLDRFVRTRLLDPLGMNDTYYLHEVQTPRERIASLYYGKPGAWTRIWESSQPFYPYAWGSQSLYSTPSDYAKFLALLLDGGVARGERILSEEAVARILEPVSVMSSLGSDVPAPTGFPAIQTHYGQMAVLYQSTAGVTAFGHSGSDGTWAWAWPEHDLMVFYFTQSRGQATGMRLETELSRLLLDPTAVASPQVLSKYSDYCGNFRADFDCALGHFNNETFSVMIHDGRLGLDVPGHFVLALRDGAPNGRWPLELDPGLAVSFSRDALGQVSGLRYHEGSSTYALSRTQERAPEVAPVFLALAVPAAVEPATAFTTMLVGQPNCSYSVEASADFESWHLIQSCASPEGRLQIRVPRASNHCAQFIRAVIGPP